VVQTPFHVVSWPGNKGRHTRLPRASTRATILVVRPATRTSYALRLSPPFCARTPFGWNLDDCPVQRRALLLGRRSPLMALKKYSRIRPPLAPPADVKKTAPELGCFPVAKTGAKGRATVETGRTAARKDGLGKQTDCFPCCHATIAGLPGKLRLKAATPTKTITKPQNRIPRSKFKKLHFEVLNQENQTLWEIL